jgi:hypothetical protein
MIAMAGTDSVDLAQEVRCRTERSFSREDRGNETGEHLESDAATPEPRDVHVPFGIPGGQIGAPVDLEDRVTVQVAHAERSGIFRSSWRNITNGLDASRLECRVVLMLGARRPKTS